MQSVLSSTLRLLKRYKLIFIFIIIVVAGFLFSNYYIHKNETLYPEIQRLDSVADTIRKNNDSIIIRIKENSEKLSSIRLNYEKDSITIINQSIDSDFEYFTNYLERFYGYNNSNTIKAN